MFLDTFIGLQTPGARLENSVLVIDLGGSYLKLGLIRSDYEFEIQVREIEIPRSAGTKEVDLFDWMVDNIKEYTGVGFNIGAALSFSYPVEIKSLSEGKVLAFTKQFPFKELQLMQEGGINPVRILNERLGRQRLNIEVKMLMNDATATFLASHRLNEKCHIAIVLGTGTNAAFLDGHGEIINSEWGQFKIENDELIEEHEMCLPVYTIDYLCGGLGFRMLLNSMFAANKTDELILSYYLKPELNEDEMVVIAAIKKRIFIFLSVMTIALVKEQKEYVIGINGSGLVEYKDRNMFERCLKETYSLLYGINIDVQLIYDPNASLIGLAHGLSILQSHKNYDKKS